MGGNWAVPRGFKGWNQHAAVLNWSSWPDMCIKYFTVYFKKRAHIFLCSPDRNRGLTEGASHWVRSPHSYPGLLRAQTGTRTPVRGSHQGRRFQLHPQAHGSLRWPHTKWFPGQNYKYLKIYTRINHMKTIPDGVFSNDWPNIFFLTIYKPFRLIRRFCSNISQIFPYIIFL